MMRGLVKGGPGGAGAGLGVRRVPRPALGPTEVLVRVAYAGICRTDVYAAEGRLPVAGEVVLGHEASGIIEAAAPESSLSAGDHVTINPLVRCADCDRCARGLGPLECAAPRRVGIDRDGVFAEWIALPASSVHVVPREMPLRRAAYVEPAAAALAVLEVLPRPHDRILVYGRGRIGRLTERVLRAHAFESVRAVTPEGASNEPESSFDLVIETVATNDTLRAALRAVRRGGRIVLKSRPFEPIALDIRLAVEKEVTLQAVRYAPFGAAIESLASNRLRVDDLLGESFTLEQHDAAFAAARREESKPFFVFPLPG